MWRLIRWVDGRSGFCPPPTPPSLAPGVLSVQNFHVRLFHTLPLRHAKPLHPTSQFRPRRPLSPITSTAAVSSSYHHVGSARAPNDFPTEGGGGGGGGGGVSYWWFMGLCSRFATPLSLELRIGPLTTVGGSASGNVRWYPSALLAWTHRKAASIFCDPSIM